MARSGHQQLAADFASSRVHGLNGSVLTHAATARKRREVFGGKAGQTTTDAQ